MAELQTVTAAISVAGLACQAWLFFKRVKDADSTANRLYEKTELLEATLRNVAAAIRRRNEQRTRYPQLPSEAQIERNIQASIKASKQVLLKIERKFEAFDQSKDRSWSTKTVAEVRLTLKQAAVARHEHDLDINIQALQTSVGALQLFGHAETQSQLEENHGENLARFKRLEGAIQRAIDLLARLSPDNTGAESKEPADGEDWDGVQTLKDVISAAETVRDTFGTIYDPDDKSLLNFPDDSGNVTGDDDEHSDMDDVGRAESDDVSDAHGGSIGSDEFAWHPNPDHDEPTPVDVLSTIIDDLKEHAQKDLDAGHSRRAETHLVEAIKLAKEREHRHKIPFNDRVEVQETLAVVYQKQMKWAEARKILHDLLRESEQPGVELAPEQALQRSRQYLQLATVYLEMYQARPRENPQEATDLGSAERFAKRAFNTRYNLSPAILDQHEASFHDSVQVLITIYEAQGRTVLAESYHRILVTTCGSTSPFPDTRRLSISGSVGSEPVVVDDKEELFFTAIKTGEQGQIQSLLPTVDVNCRCSKDRTPLMYAVEQENEIAVRKLLDHGADINATTTQGTTPLHQAAVKGNGRMARLLLELDADVEAKDAYLATPLLRAVEKNHGLLVRYLLSHNADIHVKDKGGWTLLHHAAHNGAVDVLKSLLYPSHEVDVNATCPAGKTALHYCAERTKMDAAKILLEHGADVNALDVSSRSPLFFAVREPCNQQREQFAIMLLDNGAAVDTTRLPARHRGYTALQNHISGMATKVTSPKQRRESGDTTATSSSITSTRSFWPRRFSLNKRQGQ